MGYKNYRFNLILWVCLKGALGLICLGAVSAWGQTQDLATNDDGSKLYFSSTLRLKGTDEYNNGKIFEFANGSYALIGQVTPSVTLADGSVFQFAYRMPNVSGDGSVLAYDGTASCTGGALCLGSSTTSGFITGVKVTKDITNYGSLRISHNGRYALHFGGVRGGSQYATLYDLQTGQFVPNPDGRINLGLGYELCGVAGDGRQSVKDDGTVITGCGLWRNGEVQLLHLSQPASVSRLSPNGGVLVYESPVISRCFGDLAFGYCEYNNMLYAYDLATGADVQLAKGPVYDRTGRSEYPPFFFPSLSNDGRFVLYRGPSTQLILSTTDGTAKRQLTNDPSGIAEGVLSGDAHRAYAVTQNGALLSIDIDSGQVETFLPGGVPTITKTTGPFVPGSLMTLTGTDLSTSDGHSRLSFDGPQPPILSSTQDSITIQVPWEADVNHPWTVSGANADSPFEQAASFQPVMAAPTFLGVFHADFTPVNTYNSFAKPGEILIVYMTGLGPVSPAIATGQAAPLDRLSEIKVPLHCVWDGVGQTADIQFAGLAPGTIGIYQVNIAAPGPTQGTTLVSHLLTCTSQLQTGESSVPAKMSIYVSTGP